MVIFTNIVFTEENVEADAYNDQNGVKAHVVATLDGENINFTGDSDIVKATWNIVVEHEDYVKKGKTYPSEIGVAWG